MLPHLNRGVVQQSVGVFVVRIDASRTKAYIFRTIILRGISILLCLVTTNQEILTFLEF